MEEKEILLAILAGNDEAFEKLLESYKRMIYKIIYSFRLDYGDYLISVEDLYQEACLALNEAVNCYDENKGTSFSTFAFLVIKRNVSKKIASERSLYIHEGFSIERQYEDSGYNPATADLPLLYHDEMEQRRKLMDYFKTLSKEDLRIIDLKSLDMSYAEIANCLQISTKKVDNRLYAIKKGIKDYLR